MVKKSDSHRGSPGLVTRRSKIHPPLLPRYLCIKKKVAGKSRGYVQVESSVSCRMRGIEGEETVELVFVGRLLLVPVRRSVEDGFTDKGESDV